MSCITLLAAIRRTKSGPKTGEGIELRRRREKIKLVLSSEATPVARFSKKILTFWHFCARMVVILLHKVLFLRYLRILLMPKDRGGQKQINFVEKNGTQI